MSSSKALAGEAEFPTHVLPRILPFLLDGGRPDLLSLLAVCCVSREWKAAADDAPELWRDVSVPKSLRKKMTDERLGYILAKSKGRGLTRVDVCRCTKLTDKSVDAIQANLPRLPSTLVFSFCTKVTWRSIIPLARHVLKLLKAREENQKRDPANHMYRPFRGFNLVSVDWRGCPGEQYAECFIDTLLLENSYEEHLCEQCNAVESLADCTFCDTWMYGICKKEMERCACCRGKGCPEHFVNSPQFACIHRIADSCIGKPENKRLICSQCQFARCPKCELNKLHKHPECLNCGTTVCNRCRYNDTICQCKYNDLRFVRFNKMKFPPFCAPCLSMVYGDPKHKLRTARRKRFLDPDVDEPWEPALRFCGQCGRLRSYDANFESDESSGREDARSQGDEETSDSESWDD